MTYKQYYSLIREAMTASEEMFIGELGLPDWLHDLYREDVDHMVADLRNIHQVANMAIADMRKATGMSQAAFSEHFAIPRRTLEDWERGVRTPPEYVRLMIADLLGLVTVERDNSQMRDRQPLKEENQMKEKRVIMVEAPSGYVVQVNEGDDYYSMGGNGYLLEDAIITARSTAEEIGACNAQDWDDFFRATAGNNMDALDAMLRSRESCCDWYWAFDPSYKCPEDVQVECE